MGRKPLGLGGRIQKGKAMTRYPSTAHIPQRVIDQMTPEQRKELGLKTDSERREAYEAGQERKLQADCERELSRRNIVFLHMSHRAREKQGWPDLVFPYKGRFMAVELKTGVGRLSDDQKKVLENLASNGASCHVVRSLKGFIDLFAKNKRNEYGD